MKDYTLFHPSKNLLLIVLNHSMRIDNFIDEIVVDLKDKDFCGIIYFDLLLTNGLSSRRFFKGFYEHPRIKMTNVPKDEKIPNIVLKLSNTYFSNNPYLLKNSVLTLKNKMMLLPH
jgi:hypothetical protein